MTYKRPVYEQVVIAHGGNTITLRPTLQAACILEAHHGFPALFKALDELNYTIITEIILTSCSGSQSAAAFLSSQCGRPLSHFFNTVQKPLTELITMLTPATDPKAKPGTGKRMAWPEIYAALFTRATGWLHWTPEATWRAGLRNVDSTTIRNAYTATPNAAQKLDPTENQQKAIDLAKQHDEARKGLNQTVQEGLALAQFEQSISGMSKSNQRIELELYRYIQEAKRAGLTLTDQEISKAREQITMTEQLRLSQKNAATSAEGLKNAQMFFAQSFTSSLSGLITGTTSLSDAVRNLTNSLIDAVLQATLLGQGPLAAMFGGGSGLFGSIFGFSEGGFTGRGGKYEPAGIVHKGEYVMSAAATKRIGVRNLEGLHRSAKRGFAEGGYVSGVPTLHSPDLTAVNNNSPAQAISISAPITVNGSAGTPDQNQDLAKQMAKQMEATMRGVVANEMRKQTRPGNFANSRSR